MTKSNKMITLPCDCRCCMLVIERTKWEDGDTDYNIMIQDSRYDHNCNTFWGRLKRAFSALFGKPVCFNDVFIQDEAVFKKLVEDMCGLLNE